ncbi:MAG: DUF2095 family protein [Promethearchaeota archaeon]
MVKKADIKKLVINEKDGMHITYDNEEINKYYPHLLSEITNKDKFIKIDSVEIKNENERFNDDPIQNKRNDPPKELINPGAIDFLRKCHTNKEAFEILDYLLKRKELTLQDYNSYKKQIMQDGGLKKLIEESGGFKRIGYYERKFRSKLIKK